MGAVDELSADPDYVAKFRPDELKFTDHANLAWFVTQEEPVLEG